MQTHLCIADYADPSAIMQTHLCIVVIFREAAGPCALDFMEFIGSSVATKTQFYDLIRTIKHDARNIS